MRRVGDLLLVRDIPMFCFVSLLFSFTATCTLSKSLSTVFTCMFTWDSHPNIRKMIFQYILHVQVYLRDTILSNKTASTIKTQLLHKFRKKLTASKPLFTFSLNFSTNESMSLFLDTSYDQWSKRSWKKDVQEHNCRIFKPYVQLYTTEKLIFARKRKPKSTLECWEKNTHFCSKVYSVLQFMRVITFIWVLRHSYIAGSSLLLYWVI